MTTDDWAVAYFSWMNSLPLSEVLWRWERIKVSAKEGHLGSCTKSPGPCARCTLEECIKGGLQMAKAWQVEASKEKESEA